MSGICFKQTFLCAEELYHISLKYKLYLIYVLKKSVIIFIFCNFIKLNKIDLDNISICSCQNIIYIIYTRKIK